MIIREIKREDNQQIKKLIQTSLESLNLDIEGTAYFDPQLNDLYYFYNSLTNAKYWIVEINNRVVGGIGIAPFNEEEEICELQKLYLAPETQGLGIAKKLMSTAIAFANIHYKKCYLETASDLTAACCLYEKFGFKLLDSPINGSEHTAMNTWYLKYLS